MSARESRAGLRIITRRGDPEVGAAILRFARWLRSEFEFPIRVPVYLSPRVRISTIDGEEVTASFFAPFDLTVEPYIRIATGDYSEERDERGRDNALASYLYSLAHEVLHYQQWIRGHDLSEDGVDEESVRIVERYAMTVDHP